MDNKKDKFCNQCGYELATKKLVNNIGIVLDSSSSMAGIRDQAIDMFNEQISTIRKEASDMQNKVTLVSFASQVNDPTYDGADLDSVKDSSHKNYSPNGMTALYDAIGSTIERMSRNEDKDAAYLLVVITDGYENASRDFTAEQLKELIKGKELSGNWTITFLGANQDVALAQESLGLSVSNVAKFDASPEGMLRASTNVSKGMTNYFGARRVGVQSVNNFYTDNTNKKEDENDG